MEESVLLKEVEAELDRLAFLEHTILQAAEEVDVVDPGFRKQKKARPEKIMEEAGAYLDFGEAPQAAPVPAPADYHTLPPASTPVPQARSSRNSVVYALTSSMLVLLVLIVLYVLLGSQVILYGILVFGAVGFVAGIMSIVSINNRKGHTGGHNKGLRTPLNGHTAPFHISSTGYNGLQYYDRSALPKEDADAKLNAFEMLRDEKVLKLICPALQTLSSDAKDISKVLVPILAGSAAVGLGAIAFTPTIIAWLCILITRMGIATICSDHS